VTLVVAAARVLGRPLRTRSTGGGSDANVFASRGIEVANLGCGMREIHTVNEWVDIKDVVVTSDLVLQTVRLNAAA
jgi:tripeptide aminopeptidase